jgi:hypothetical protein
MQSLLARNESTRVPEPKRIDPRAGRPLDREPRLRPQLPELEFDPWHVARVMGASARGTASPATTTGTMTAGTMTAGTMTAGTTTAGTGAGTANGSEAPRLSTLAGVAEKFFRLGHAREAERILRPALWDFLQRCEGNRRHIESGIERHAPPIVKSYVKSYAESYAESYEDGYAENHAEKEIELAGKLALRLATDTNAVQWIDYLFRLFTAVSRPLSSELIEQLHDLMRRAPGVSRNGFLRYLSALRACRQEFGPGEHFLIRRIEGLEPLLGQ